MTAVINPAATTAGGTAAPVRSAAPSAGAYANSGNGPSLLPLDIGHADYLALTDPATAFWALVRKERLAEALGEGPLLAAYREKSAAFGRELHAQRFELKPTPPN